MTAPLPGHAWLSRHLADWQTRLGRQGQAVVTLDRRRIFVLPTAAGLAYAGVLALMLLTAINYSLSLGFALVFGLAGLGFVAMFHSFRNLVEIRIEALPSDPVHAGHPAVFALRTHSVDARPRLALRIGIRPDEAHCFDLPGDAALTLHLRCAAPRRGWLACPRVRLDTCYPLGLVRAWAYANTGQRCLVYPAVDATRPPLPRGSASGQGESAPVRRPGEDDFAHLREHRPSDSPRHVAWKAAARSADEQPLLTKQFESSGSNDLWLDWYALPADLDDETRLSRLTGWVLDADQAGLRWGLKLPDLELAPAGGAAHCTRALRALALFGLRDPAGTVQ